MKLSVRRLLSSMAWLVLVALAGSCKKNSPTVLVGGPQIVAFSLRAANELLAQGRTNDETLHSLGGITRFAGMIFDREGKDIILVGKADPELPAATLDDLAVALRGRLLKGGCPRVSIDTVAETAKTGMQAVRTQGGIDRSQFGADFIASDVVLKRYSLDLLTRIPGVDPYLKLYEGAARKRLEAQGHDKVEACWLSEAESSQAVARHLGKQTVESRAVQNRFWFHARDEESFIVQKDDVFVIEELRLGVKMETLSNTARKGAQTEPDAGADSAAAEFARQFTAGYQQALAQNPPLKRLKVLFDMVCLAEGIAHLGQERPELDPLLHAYRVRAVDTPTQFPVIHRVAEFRAKNNVSLLAEVSGGIDLEAVLLALDDGDVSGLKLAVIGTRPDQHALSWPLPLQDWKMPNSEGLAALPRAESTNSPSHTPKKEIGSAINVQQYVFDPANSRPDDPVFNGFLPPGITDPLGPSELKFQFHDRLRPGGVSMLMKLDKRSFRRGAGSALPTMQGDALAAKPTTNALSWPVPLNKASNDPGKKNN